LFSLAYAGAEKKPPWDSPKATPAETEVFKKSRRLKLDGFIFLAVGGRIGMEGFRNLGFFASVLSKRHILSEIFQGLPSIPIIDDQIPPYPSCSQTSEIEQKSLETRMNPSSVEWLGD
jgi:hypothetical protein